MVSRIKPIMTRRRSALDIKKGRPKRNASPKNLDDSVSGLSWREERELKKALYASLQEARRHSRDDKPDETCDDTCIMPESHRPKSPYIKKSQSLPILQEPKFYDESSCSQDSNRSFSCSKDSDKLTEAKKPAKFHAQRKFAVNSFVALRSESMNSEQSGSDTSQLSCPKKIHAQRKFAQGYLPSSSCETLTRPKLKVSPVKLFPTRPTTEDFLTYLCFRGTSVLPPHLDLMRKEELQPDQPAPGINGKGAGFTRDSSPASSSSTSHNNDDSLDVSDAPSSHYQTPNKKAARASASTPQTAQGFANLHYRLSEKSSPLARDKTSSSRLSPRGSSSRKRLADSYQSAHTLKSRSKHRGTVSDRLSLKRKAMATLTAAKLGSSPGKARADRRLRTSMSDGALMNRKRPTVGNRREANGRSTTTRISYDKTQSPRKRQLPKELSEKYVMTSTSKRPKIRSSKRVETIMKSKASDRVKMSARSRLADRLETHPRKRLGTRLKSSKTFKPQRPMTRACTHLKSVLKAAKLAANNKLRKLKRAGRAPSLTVSPTASSSTASSSPRTPEQKRSRGAPGDKRRSDGSSSNSPSGSATVWEPRQPGEEVAPGGDVACTGVLACPTYHPTEEQFRDPILYIQSVEEEAERYGMCKIVPPSSWKMESRELEDMRFATEIQYIHKMQNKWSAITEQLECIKQLYEKEGNEKFCVPQIGGVDIDLVKLYELVQKYGGMKGTSGKEKKWVKIADAMKIPKQADRVSKLYGAYCKFLLSYETLSEEETEKLVKCVQAERLRQEREAGKTLPPFSKSVFKGKSQPLSAFHRAARNTEGVFQKDGGDTIEQIEADYWATVRRSDDHVAVQSASLDTSIHGSMFPVRRDSTYARHGWNLHNLIESKGSILHHLGLIAGVTVPTLHIGMQFTTRCLSCNVHNLPTVHYLHQGPGLVWYSVPSQDTDKLKYAVADLVPHYLRDKGFAIQPDSLMVEPEKLLERGVSVSRCVQKAREFVVVFPRSNYCNISLGYNLAESVNFATKHWIPLGFHAAQDLSANHDVELFSMDAMLVFLAQDPTTSESTLAILCPYLEKVVDREIGERRKLVEAGLRESERLQDKISKHAQKSEVLEEIIICDTSNKICYLSMVLNVHENSAFSLQQGLQHIQKKKNIKHCKLMYRYSEEELRNLVRDVKNKIKVTSPPTSGSSPKRKGLRNLDQKISPTLK